MHFSQDLTLPTATTQWESMARNGATCQGARSRAEPTQLPTSHQRRKAVAETQLINVSETICESASCRLSRDAVFSVVVSPAGSLCSGSICLLEFESVFVDNNGKFIYIYICFFMRSGVYFFLSALFPRKNTGHFICWFDLRVHSASEGRPRMSDVSPRVWNLRAVI